MGSSSGLNMNGLKLGCKLFEQQKQKQLLRTSKKANPVK
jgi:hypothetical protein